MYWLKTTYSWQKSYADNKRIELELEEGDKVYLKISPMNGVMRSGTKGKLCPRYVGPYEIFQRFGKVSYELRLPSELSLLDSIIHISILKKCIGEPQSILPIEGLYLDENSPMKGFQLKSLVKNWISWGTRRRLSKRCYGRTPSWGSNMGGRGQHEVPLSSFFW